MMFWRKKAIPEKKSVGGEKPKLTEPLVARKKTDEKRIHLKLPCFLLVTALAIESMISLPALLLDSMITFVNLPLEFM
ncbi:MAG: hypothetical protein ACOX5R_17650 [bacterium]|jgi:hypothetical protein